MSVCVFGDSIAWGAYDPVSGGWVTLLRNYVEREWERFNDISVYNLGICDDTTTKLLKRFESEYIIRDPGLVILAVGTNDARYIQTVKNRETKPQQFIHNINNLISVAQKYTTKIILVGLAMGDESTTTPLYGEKDPGFYYLQSDIKMYDQFLHQAAKNYNLPFIDVNNLLSNSDFDPDDGLHPNTKGHQKIFSAVKPVIEKMLQSN